MLGSVGGSFSCVLLYSSERVLSSKKSEKFRAEYLPIWQETGLEALQSSLDLHKPL